MRFARLLLAAQSPVLRGMLYGSMAEAARDAVVRVGFPLKVVQQMLQYVCNAQLALDRATVLDLHRLADFYQIEQLKVMTASFIEDELTDETAVEFWVGARRCKMGELESRCLEYVQQRPSEVLQGDRIFKLSEGCLLTLIQTEELNMRELEVFNAVVRWGKGQLTDDSLKDRLAPLMESVRFPLMSGEELAQQVVPTGLVRSELMLEALQAKFLKELPVGRRFAPRSPLCTIEIESQILDWQMKLTLQKMLPTDQRVSCRLVHDMSRGARASDFDAAVKLVGPTLTLIREASTKYVFGAYVHDTYGQGRGWVPGSMENFLFTLGNVTGNPVKLIRDPADSGNAWFDGCGLHLGTDFVAFCSWGCNPRNFTRRAEGYLGAVTRATLSGVEFGRYVPELAEVFAVTRSDL